MTIEFIRSEEWNDYASNALHQTQELDRQPLGGARPEHIPAGAQGAVKFGSNDDDYKPKAAQSIPAELPSELDDTFTRGEMSTESADTHNDQV